MDSRTDFSSGCRRTVYSHFSEEVLSSPEAWQRAKQRAGIPDGDPDTDYAKVKEAWASGQIVFSGQPAFYLKQGTQLVVEIDACLKQLKWDWLVSESGQFIGFDSPVAMDVPQGQAVGFRNAAIVIYPVNRHLLLYGTREAVEWPYLTTKLIARHNTFAMLSADEHDLAAVRNAITERWSNGQTEGQINRLKTLKRQMYGRAGTELLHARLLPFVHDE